MFRSTKRARVSATTEGPISSSSSLIASAPDKHTLFTSWAQDRGITIKSAAAKVLPGRGAGLVATKNIKSKSPIVSVPSTTLFKPDAKVLKRHALDRTASPQAKLAFSLTVALAEGNLAEWSSTWPTMGDFEASMPMFWPEHVLAHLPSSVAAPLARQRTDYTRDRACVQKAVKSLGLSERMFGYAWCIANSRSFSWKGQMVLCPWVDYMNHAAKGSCEVIVGEGGFEVKAAGDVAEGEELTFAYGAHSNDKLLVHYGFVPESTIHHASPDDEIRLDHVILPQLSEHVKSQLQDLGYLGSYALLAPENPCSGSSNCSKCGAQVWELCFKTQVAIRAAVLSCNEWEYFATNGEDLVEDQSHAVFEWLRPFLDNYRLEADREMSAINRLCITDKEKAAAWASLDTRWQQTRNALAAHLEANDM
nr:hypothetical protein B0A51_03486 [Rachicladosporium sp. CCFEE 5018]